MVSVILIVILIVASAIGVYIYKLGKQEQDEEQTIVGLATSSLAGIAAIITLMANIFFSVDEGESILLTQFGRIYSIENQPGIHLIRPWAETIEWVTRLKSVNESINARTVDDMILTVDITFWWSVDPNKVDVVYSKIAKNYKDLEKGFVIPGLRSTLRDEIAKTSFRELNTNREKYALQITKYIAKQLKVKHIIIDKVNIRNVVPPKSVNKSIERKIQAEQMVEEATQRLELAKKDADIKRIEAQGIADAQRIIQKKLSPIYVQYEGIQMMKSLAKSENTTFIFAPTSMRGIGIPAVYGAPIK